MAVVEKVEKVGKRARSFQETQRQFAGHLRNPQQVSPPDGIEERRLNIYRELIYNNIESFIRTGFPVLQSLYGDESWEALVRCFIVEHRCESPYFPEISQEFLHFLQEQFAENPPEDKPFLLELAHYEWVELALSLALGEAPDPEPVDKSVLWRTPLAVSPLAWRLSYQYPVHHLGKDYQPPEPPEQPTFLVVYRQFDDEVKFMEVNAVTSRLIQLFEESGNCTGGEGLALIAGELGQPLEQIQAFGMDLLDTLVKAGILYAAPEI